MQMLGGRVESVCAHMCTCMRACVCARAGVCQGAGGRQGLGGVSWGGCDFMALPSPRRAG